MPQFSKTCAWCSAAFETEGRSARYCCERCSLAGRYEQYVVRGGDDECWSWQGFAYKGYGRLRTSAGVIGAHRVSYQLHWGEVPSGLTVLHSCDNPACTNPRHLFVGTNADNNKDRDRKGRQARGEKVGNAILSESQVDEIRELRRSGVSIRKVGRRMGLNANTVWSVVSRRNWKHVP